MARITNLPSFLLKPVWIWDLHQPVGYGLSNRRDDVLLVQVALNRVMEPLKLRDNRKMGALGPLGREFPPLAQLKTDGHFGPETYNAVRTYQDRAGKSDGVADPVHPLVQKGLSGDPTSGRILATMAVHGRMIYRLNRDHVAIHGRMMEEADFPAELRHAVARAS